MFELSEKQLEAAAAVKAWWQSHLDYQTLVADDRAANVASPDPFFYLAGYAGSGKTSIAKYLVEQLPPPTIETGGFGADSDYKPRLTYAFAAFTGKAALVLSRKNCRPASTVHRLIYIPVEDPKTKEITFELRENLDIPLDLLILDECSMVGDEMGRDLLSFNVPILVLGDPGQLPPIDGAGFFTQREPHYFLSEIHRQAAESPILKMATLAREGKPLPKGLLKNEQSTVSVLQQQAPVSTILMADQIICGTNKLRQDLNNLVRKHKGIESTLPVKGEKIICLKNNWDLTNMANGSIWKVEDINPIKNEYMPNRLKLELSDWDNPDLKVSAVSHEWFFDPTVVKPDNQARWAGLTHFTFGYAITCHKSQGSEWNDVLVYNESMKFREDSAKWLYTAITRAARNLIIA